MLIRGKKINCSERQLSQPNLAITLTNQDVLTPSYLKDFNELSTDPKLAYFEGIQTSFVIERPNQATIHLPRRHSTIAPCIWRSDFGFRTLSIAGY